MIKIINAIVAYGAIIMNITACYYYFNVLAVLTILCIFVVNKEHYIKTKDEWFDRWSNFKYYLNSLCSALFMLVFLFNEIILPAVGYMLALGMLGIKQGTYKELSR